MRALPPTTSILGEIFRVVSTLKDLQKINLDESALEEEWPIPPPVSFSTPDGFSQMLEDASNYNINPKTKDEQQKALKRLSPEERQTLVGLPPHSQWKYMISIAKVPPPPLEEDAVSEESQILNIVKLASRFKALSGLKRGFEPRYRRQTGEEFTASSCSSSNPILLLHTYDDEWEFSTDDDDDVDYRDPTLVLQ
jgi:hypothetical protein